MPKPGDAFRDAIAAFLRAANYTVETEITLSGKNVDIFAAKRVRFSEERLVIDAKDYEGVVNRDEVSAFRHDYSAIIDDGLADTAILVTKNGITPQGKQILDGKKDLIHCTWSVFQREIFGIDSYLTAIVDENTSRLADNFYIPPKTSAGIDLHDLVEEWIAESNPPPLAALGGYGLGKSTFATALANRMASAALVDPNKRIPIVVPLGEIVDENSLEGLFGKLFTSRYSIDGYNFSLFRQLNRLGRFLIVLDGLDEMKHGMTFHVFQREVRRLLELHEGDSRLLLLGRPNAFPTEKAFRAVLKGALETQTGEEVVQSGRVVCRDVSLAEWNTDDALAYVSNRLGKLGHATGLSADEIALRTAELKSRFSDLIRRPVHASMLVQLASAPQFRIKIADDFSLFDQFLTLLLDREVSKTGRLAAIGLDARRSFNAAVSWWLMTQGGISSTALTDVPYTLVDRAARGVDHGLDREQLKAEFLAGCLVEKAAGVFYFGHRSIQEFLAAQHLFDTNMLIASLPPSEAISQSARHSTAEIGGFVLKFYERMKTGAQTARTFCAELETYRGDLPRDKLQIFFGPYEIASRTRPETTPWPFAIKHAHSGTALRALLPTIASGGREVALMALQLYCMEADASELNEAAIDLLATLLERSSFREYVPRARTNSFAYVNDADDPLGFCLVNAINREVKLGDGVGLPITVKALGRTAHKLLGYGPRADSPDDLRDLGRQIVVTGPQLYRRLNWSSNELDKIRALFTQEATRLHIRPLEKVILTPRPTGKQGR